MALMQTVQKLGGLGYSCDAHEYARKRPGDLELEDTVYFWEERRSYGFEVMTADREFDVFNLNWKALKLYLPHFKNY